MPKSGCSMIFFAQLLQELEQRNLLQNTVIIGVTDHYAYTMNDQQRVRELSHVPVDLLVERTPCFIWSADMQPDDRLQAVQYSRSGADSAQSLRHGLRRIPRT